jgi:hypothetical protein
MFTSFLVYGPGSGSETLELRIRIRQKFRILADPDPQHWDPEPQKNDAAPQHWFLLMLTFSFLKPRVTDPAKNFAS